MLKKIFLIKFRVLLKESACYSAGFNGGNTVIYKEKKSLDIFDKSKIWFTSLSSRDYVMKKVHRKLILIIFFSWQLESGHKKWTHMHGFIVFISNVYQIPTALLKNIFK